MSRKDSGLAYIYIHYSREKVIHTALRCWFRPPLQRTRKKPLLLTGGAATNEKCIVDFTTGTKFVNYLKNPLSTRSCRDNGKLKWTTGSHLQGQLDRGADDGLHPPEAAVSQSSSTLKSYNTTLERVNYSLTTGSRTDDRLKKLKREW